MPQRRPKRRFRRYSEGKDSELARLKARLRRLSVPCPRCSTGDDLWEDVTQACVICEDTGTIDAWHALPALKHDGLERPPYTSDDADQVRLLRSRLDARKVTCPYCRGTGRAAKDHPCPVCEREGTVSAWESATLMMVGCPHCQGYGTGGAPGMGWDCVFCRTTKEVPLGKAVGYSPEAVRECGDFNSIEQMLAEFGAAEWDNHRAQFDVRKEARPGRSWSRIDVSDDDLTGVDLKRSSLDGTRFGDLSGSNLSDCLLDDAHIDQADGATFVRASMDGVRLWAGSFTGANFRSTDLQRARARLADFSGARFERATLDGADLAGATVTGSTISRAASLSGTNLFGAVGITPRQKAVCERKGAVFVEPSNPDWREGSDEDLDEDAFD